MIYVIPVAALLLGSLYFTMRSIRVDDKGIHFDSARMVAMAKTTLLVGGVASLFTWTAVAIVILFAVALG